MTYFEYIHEVIKRHDFDFTVDTSPMDKNGQYYKTYMFSDGAVLTVINRPVYETKKVTFEVKGVSISQEITVKLFESEVFSTDDSRSKFFYELF